jgi:hypothetical protein
MCDVSVCLFCCMWYDIFNPLNAKLNPICHLLALLGAHPILHVSRIRVNCNWVASRWQFSTHIHTIHRTSQNKQYTEQHKNLEECGPGPVFAGFTLAFALQLRKKHGKTSVRVVIHKHKMRIHSHTVRSRNEYFMPKHPKNTYFHYSMPMHVRVRPNFLSKISLFRTEWRF